MKSEIPDGTVNKIDFRELEYFIKCPLRHTFNKQRLSDPSVVVNKAIDQTIAYYTLRYTVGERLTVDNMVAQFDKRYEAIINSTKNFDSLYLSQRDDSITTRVSKLFSNFYRLMTDIDKKYNLIMPSYEAQYSYSGTSIELLVHLPLKRLDKKSAIGKPYHIILDYSDTTQHWNTLGKLWMTAVTYSLQDRGVNTIEVSLLNLNNLKMLITKPDDFSMARQMLDGMCSIIASEYSYPIPGGHCFQCAFQQQCSRSMNQ